MRRIDFFEEEPRYCSAEPALQCRATVDGEPACYEITAEALEDHFGALTYRREDLLRAYSMNTEKIQNAARRMFEMTGAREIVLHSGYFRFDV